MPKYKFSEIAFNITDKKMPEPGDEELYIGLEHLDSGSLRVTRWGSEVELVGQKLVMQKGDILFGRRNTYLRRAAIAPHDGIFSAHGMIFRPNTNVIDPDYFPFFISSDYFMDAAIRISVGSLSPTVNWKTLKELEFYLPDLNQQRHTAELLSAANETKEAYQDLLLKTDELVKSQFIELFGTPANNHHQLPVVALGKVAKLQGGYAFKSKEFVDCGVKLVQISNVNADYLDWDTIVHVPKSYLEKYSAFRLNAGDLVMAMTRPVIKGQNAVKIAKVSNSDVPCLLNQRVGRFKISNSINKIYLETLCKSEDFRDYVVQMSGNSLQPNISSRQVESYEILLPSIEDQEQFSAFVEQLDKSKFSLQIAIYRAVW